MKKPLSYTSLNSEIYLNYGALDLDFLSMFFQDSDAFYLEGLNPRDEDVFRDLKFDIRVDLKRESYCASAKRRIVHDMMRVWDVKHLMLQTLVWPSKFAHAAHLVRTAADLLIGQARARGARVLINAFFDMTEDFGLRKALSIPLTPRVNDISTSERHLENAAQALVIGHEVGHYLVHSAGQKIDLKDDLELKCDAAGLELSLRFDQSEYFWTVEAAWDGPEPTEHSAIGWVWRLFEHFVTAVLWGDALLLRSRKCIEGESDDPFPLARRRTKAMINKFRSTETGQREPPFRDLPIAPLEEAFDAINALVKTTINPSEERFSVRLSRDPFTLPREHYELESYWTERLYLLGLDTSLCGVIIPRAEDHPGMDKWRSVYRNNTMSPPEPHRYRGPDLPGKDRRHRFFGSGVD